MEEQGTHRIASHYSNPRRRGENQSIHGLDPVKRRLSQELVDAVILDLKSISSDSGTAVKISTTNIMRYILSVLNPEETSDKKAAKKAEYEAAAKEAKCLRKAIWSVLSGNKLAITDSEKREPETYTDIQQRAPNNAGLQIALLWAFQDPEACRAILGSPLGAEFGPKHMVRLAELDYTNKTTEHVFKDKFLSCMLDVLNIKSKKVSDETKVLHQYILTLLSEGEPVKVPPFKVGKNDSENDKRDKALGWKLFFKMRDSSSNSLEKDMFLWMFRYPEVNRVLLASSLGDKLKGVHLVRLAELDYTDQTAVRILKHDFFTWVANFFRRLFSFPEHPSSRLKTGDLMRIYDVKHKSKPILGMLQYNSLFGPSFREMTLLETGKLLQNLSSPAFRNFSRLHFVKRKIDLRIKNPLRNVGTFAQMWAADVEGFMNNRSAIRKTALVQVRLLVYAARKTRTARTRAIFLKKLYEIFGNDIIINGRDKGEVKGLPPIQSVLFQEKCSARITADELCDMIMRLKDYRFQNIVAKNPRLVALLKSASDEKLRNMRRSVRYVRSRFPYFPSFSYFPKKSKLYKLFYGKSKLYELLYGSRRKNIWAVLAQRKQDHEGKRSLEKLKYLVGINMDEGQTYDQLPLSFYQVSAAVGAPEAEEKEFRAMSLEDFLVKMLDGHSSDEETAIFEQLDVLMSGHAYRAIDFWKRFPKLWKLTKVQERYSVTVSEDKGVSYQPRELYTYVFPPNHEVNQAFFEQIRDEEMNPEYFIGGLSEFKKEVARSDQRFGEAPVFHWENFAANERILNQQLMALCKQGVDPAVLQYYLMHINPKGPAHAAATVLIGRISASYDDPTEAEFTLVNSGGVLNGIGGVPTVAAIAGGGILRTETRHYSLNRSSDQDEIIAGTGFFIQTLILIEMKPDGIKEQIVTKLLIPNPVVFGETKIYKELFDDVVSSQQFQNQLSPSKVDDVTAWKEARLKGIVDELAHSEGKQSETFRQCQKENSLFAILSVATVEQQFSLCTSEIIDKVSWLRPYLEKQLLHDIKFSERSLNGYTYNLKCTKGRPEPEGKKCCFLYRDVTSDEIFVSIVYDKNTHKVFSLTDILRNNGEESLLDALQWSTEDDQEVMLDDQLVQIITQQCRSIALSDENIVRLKQLYRLPKASETLVSVARRYFGELVADWDAEIFDAYVDDPDAFASIVWNDGRTVEGKKLLQLVQDGKEPQQLSALFLVKDFDLLKKALTHPELYTWASKNEQVRKDFLGREDHSYYETSELYLDFLVLCILNQYPEEEDKLGAFSREFTIKSDKMRDKLQAKLNKAAGGVAEEIARYVGNLLSKLPPSPITSPSPSPIKQRLPAGRQPPGFFHSQEHKVAEDNKTPSSVLSSGQGPGVFAAGEQ